MTITPRHTHRRVVKFWRTLDHLALALPEAIHNARLAELAALADVVPGEGGGRAKGHISDPTGETATKILDAGRETAVDAEEILDTIGLSLKMLAGYVRSYTGVDVYDDANAPEHRRCGEFTPKDIKLADWYTTPNQRGRTPASCTDDALYSVADNGTITWAAHGLCPADYQAMRRALIIAGTLDRGAEWVA